MVVEEAEEYKKRGNELFKDKKWEEAIKQYNKAITLDPDNAAYYSNRSAAWSYKGNHESALADANRCIQKDANFAKGYARKGKACFDLGQVKEAEEAYKEGLAKEPGNDACSRGLDDISNSRRRAAGGGGGGGGFGGGGIVEKLMAQMKRGGRMQMYMVVMVAYFAYNNFMGGSKDKEKGDGIGGDYAAADPAADDDYAPASAGAVGRVSRRFKELDSQWYSYMQTDIKSETLLLMLHRTSSSAEVEFSKVFPGLAKAAGSTSRIVAPDRPCHGFTPCPSGGEPEDAAPWLSKFVRAGGTPAKIAVVAVGREAAAQALALAGRRKEVQHILFMSPKVVAPPRGKVTKAEELHAWLKKHKYPATGQAAADAIRWAAAGSEALNADLNVEKLPVDCKISILYDAADEEDEQFRASLEAQGAEVKTRSATGDDSLMDVLTDEVAQALAPADAAGMDMDN